MCEIPLSKSSIDLKKEKRNGEKMSKKRKEKNKSYITYFTEWITFLITYVLQNTKKPDKFGHNKKRIAGIEPVSPAWEASVLPMNYIRAAIKAVIQIIIR